MARKTLQKNNNGLKGFLVLFLLVMLFLSLSILNLSTNQANIENKSNNNYDYKSSQHGTKGNAPNASPSFLDTLRKFEKEKWTQILSLEGIKLYDYMLELQKREEVLFQLVIPERSINLIYAYQSKSDSELHQQQEVILKKHIENNAIDFIHIVLENKSAYPIDILDSMPTNLTSRVITHIVSRPWSYSLAIQYAQKRLDRRIVILSYASIFFDHSLNQLREIDLYRQNKTYFLPSYGVRMDGSIDNSYCNEQSTKLTVDSYIYMPPLHNIDSLTYPLDIPFGDNGLEGQTIKQLPSKASLTITNPCHILKSYHFETHKLPSHEIPHNQTNLVPFVTVL